MKSGYYIYLRNKWRNCHHTSKIDILLIECFSSDFIVRKRTNPGTKLACPVEYSDEIVSCIKPLGPVLEYLTKTYDTCSIINKVDNEIFK